MMWVPYHGKGGYNGVSLGNIEWSGDSQGHNEVKTLKIRDREVAKEIIKDLEEAIEKGYYENK